MLTKSLNYDIIKRLNKHAYKNLRTIFADLSIKRERFVSFNFFLRYTIILKVEPANGECKRENALRKLF